MQYPMLQKGFDLLKEELVMLKANRLKIAERIEDARKQGDVQENSGYEAVREEQGLEEVKIAKLEDRLSRAIVINPKIVSNKTVQFGHTVKIVNCDTEENKTFQIVSEDEAAIREGKIAINSPLVQCMLGSRKGDVVSYTAPNGEFDYEILKISNR